MRDGFLSWLAVGVGFAGGPAGAVDQGILFSFMGPGQEIWTSHSVASEFQERAF